LRFQLLPFRLRRVTFLREWRGKPINSALDRLMILTQQLKEKTDRAILLSASARKRLGFELFLQSGRTRAEVLLG
jgi:hypothetical protein